MDASIQTHIEKIQKIYHKCKKHPFSFKKVIFYEKRVVFAIQTSFLSPNEDSYNTYVHQQIVRSVRVTTNYFSSTHRNMSGTFVHDVVLTNPRGSLHGN